VYATTTSPASVTGDAIALALRAGAVLRDPEFVQFHPTVLHLPNSAPGQRPLITEALRGAGATLLTHDGRPLMAGRHPLGDLAPRDVVSAVMAERIADGDPHLWLDATGLGEDELETGFPTVTAACRAHGIDPVTEPIPVEPGAHYFCGGILADLDGRTSVPGLFAIGEAASTGIQGANRLASNSVTEAIITGTRTARAVGGGPEVLPRGNGGRAASRELGGFGGDRSPRESMSRYAGVVRDAEGLVRLLAQLGPTPSTDSLHTCSVLIATAALARRESRGCHRRRDFPATDPEPYHTLIRWDGAELITSRAPVGSLVRT
jgi:L-aspartate oxidase